MKTIFFCILLFTCTNVMRAQNIAGEYYLEGVMETASGFQLSADSGFQFFYSYGALDRFGKGKWKMLDLGGEVRALILLTIPMIH